MFVSKKYMNEIKKTLSTLMTKCNNLEYRYDIIKDVLKLRTNYGDSYYAGNTGSKLDDLIKHLNLDYQTICKEKLPKFVKRENNEN